MLKRLFNFIFLVFFLLFSGFAMAQENQATDCDKYPGSLGCSPVDIPSSEQIPQRSQEITLQNGPNFGGAASCPANVSMSFRGQSLTLLPMSTACSWISQYMRPIVLLLAAITAVFIVLPSNEDY